MQGNLMWTLKQLHLSLEQYGRLQMKAIDISPTQGIVLQYLLSQKSQAMYAVDLHAALGISKSTVSSTLRGLKQKGYLIMTENPADDRKKQIVLTDKAFDMKKTIDVSLQEQQKQLCKAISPQRLKWLEDDLTIMLTNIRNESGLEEPL